jgi:serine/threonine protein kinase
MSRNVANDGRVDRMSQFTRIRKIGQGSYGTVDLVKYKGEEQLYVMKRVKNVAHGREQHKIEALREVSSPLLPARMRLH